MPRLVPSLRPLRHAARAAAVALAAVALAAACAPTEPADPRGALAVEIGGDALRLTNRSDRMVFTFVVDRELLSLIDWMPCADPVACHGLTPGATRAVQYGAFSGLEPGREAIVIWWHGRRTASGYEPDSLRMFTVRL